MTLETATIPDRAAIRADIEQVKTDFHELLGSLSQEDWKRKSANPAWTVGQLMWHVARGMEFFSEAVEFCRKGKAPNPPGWIINIGNVLLTRFGSRGATPESVSRKFDTAHDVLLGCLDSVKDDEWGLGVTAYGTPHTIESTLRGPREHFREHEVDILKGLGRL